LPTLRPTPSMPIDARDLHTLKGKSKGNIGEFGVIERGTLIHQLWHLQNTAT